MEAKQGRLGQYGKFISKQINSKQYRNNRKFHGKPYSHNKRMHPPKTEHQAEEIVPSSMIHVKN